MDSNRRSFLGAALGGVALAPASVVADAQAPGAAAARVARPDAARLVRARRRSSIPTPTSSRSTRASAATSSATRRSSGCTPARCGPKGPAWNGVGRYLVWSDIPNNVQMRWIEDDGHVTVFRNPSGYSNGNTFDYEGRQLSCEHGGRRVVRYEPNGTVTVIADKFQGKRLNSPNDIVVHPDGGIWFTDPDLRHPRQLRRLQGRAGDRRKPSTAWTARPGRSTRSPTKSASRTASAFRRTTRSSTSPTPARRATSRSATSTARRCATASASSQLDIPGTGAPSAADGIRCDVDGNIWAGARPGVQVIAPNGERIGMIRLPETCANVCFGGTKRNRLFMAASQSLYAVYVETTGAHIA